MSEVKLTISSSEESYVILTMANSIEFEGELKLRFGSCATTVRDFRIPASVYMGMFAGATKPKPFQRKRPNQSFLPAGKLPSLHDMRGLALELHKGSYKPCPPGESRRLELAMQHIYEGYNTFGVMSLKGAAGLSSQWRYETVVSITDEAIIIKPNGPNGAHSVEFAFEDIEDWVVIDHERDRKDNSGIEISSSSGDKVFIGVVHIRDVKHTLEYFWNQYRS